MAACGIQIGSRFRGIFCTDSVRNPSAEGWRRGGSNEQRGDLEIDFEGCDAWRALDGRRIGERVFRNFESC